MTKQGITMGAMVCLAAFWIARPTNVSRGEPGKPQEEKTETRSTAQSKTAESEPGSRIAVQIKLSAEGVNRLPSGSRIELKGDESACGTLERVRDLDPDGNVTFSGLPVCRVKLKISVTGFETKMARAELAKYKDSPMRIQIRATGPPAVE